MNIFKIKHITNLILQRKSRKFVGLIFFAIFLGLVLFNPCPQKAFAQLSPNAQTMKQKQKQLSQEGQARKKIAGKRVRTRIKEVRDPKKAFDQNFNRIPNAPKANYLYIQP